MHDVNKARKLIEDSPELSSAEIVKKTKVEYQSVLFLRKILSDSNMNKIARDAAILDVGDLKKKYNLQPWRATKIRSIATRLKNFDMIANLAVQERTKTRPSYMVRAMIPMNGNRDSATAIINELIDQLKTMKEPISPQKLEIVQRMDGVEIREAI